MSAEKKCISVARTATTLLVPTCAVVISVFNLALMGKLAMVKNHINHVYT